MDDGKKDAAKGPTTTTTVQEYDADGALIRETTTTTVRIEPEASHDWPGQYL